MKQNKRKTRIRAKPEGKFKSQLEVKLWNDLKRKTKGTQKQVMYETEKLSYTLERFYMPDFILLFHNGMKRYIEGKGYFRSTDRTKMLAVKQAHPHLDIRIIFPIDNKLTSKSNTRYSDWCIKHGFPYHIGTEIPKEWLKQPRKKRPLRRSSSTVTTPNS